MTNSPSELTVEDSGFYIYAAHYTIIDNQGLIQCVLAQLEYGSHKNKDHVSAREVTVLTNPEVAQKDGWIEFQCMPIHFSTFYQ